MIELIEDMLVSMNYRKMVDDNIQGSQVYDLKVSVYDEWRAEYLKGRHGWSVNYWVCVEGGEDYEVGNCIDVPEKYFPGIDVDKIRKNMEEKLIKMFDNPREVVLYKTYEEEKVAVARFDKWIENFNSEK